MTTVLLILMAGSAAVLATFVGWWVVQVVLDHRAKREFAEARFRIAPSPLIPSRQLEAARRGHRARIDQQGRRANVITAIRNPTTGVFTLEFERYVEQETGKAPAGRGPREADVRRARQRPASEWSQDQLFEVAS